MPTYHQEPTPRSEALRFWTAFAASDDQACKDALRDLEAALGVEINDFSTADTSPSESGELGKFVKADLPTTSPKNAQDAWISDKRTTLLRVDPSYHCLSLDGDLSKYQGGEYFVACASPGRDALTADACTIGTHGQAKRTKLDLPGPAYVIKVKASSLATKPKVLTGTYVIETDIPSDLLANGTVDDLLLTLETKPIVWKCILDSFPGKETLREPEAKPAAKPLAGMKVDTTSSLSQESVESVTHHARTTDPPRLSMWMMRVRGDLSWSGADQYKPRFTMSQDDLSANYYSGRTVQTLAKTQMMPQIGMATFDAWKRMLSS
jgi:hypothetical protein